MDPDLNQIVVPSLRGGLNLTDPPAFLSEDQGPVSENLDFSDATVGATRKGAIRVTGPSGATGVITTLYRHMPDNDLANALLLLAQNLSNTISAWVKGATWSSLTFADAVTGADLGTRPLQAQSLHGKLFLAYPSAVDRLHVVDSGGTTVRRAGFAISAAPTVADTGSGAYPPVPRFYRQRYTTQVTGVTVRRSEPSASVAFTPSGSGTAARVTKGTAISEGETHWEIEASTDNVLFYRIATVAVGTTTYDDSAAPSTYAENPLSEDIGDYTPLWSAKYLAVDDDRLLLAGSWEDEALKSRVGWTPVRLSPGVGNDERLELDTDPFLDLDGIEGGEITAMSRALNAYIHVYKWGHVYRLIRTGARARAYEAIAISKSVGAFPGSIVSAFDENGAPAEYFWDPTLGPQRLGVAGIQDCGRDIRDLVKTVNQNAEVPVASLYYPEKDQVWYWVATGTSEFPNTKLVFQIRDGRPSGEGVRKGWTRHSAPGEANSTAGVRTAALFADNIEANAARSTKLLPLVGAGTLPTGLLQADTGLTDNGKAYEAQGETKPFIPSGLLRKVGVMAATAVGRPGYGYGLTLTAIRDYGVEEKSVDVDLSPAGAADRRIVPLDDFTLSELRSIAFRFGSRAEADFLSAQAIGFDGAASGASRAFSSGVVDDFTFGGWFYPDGAAAGSIPFNIGDVNGNGYGLQLTSDRWHARYSGVATFDSGAAATDATWAHVAVRRRAGVSQIFVNGVAAGATSALVPLAPNGTFRLGLVNDFSGRAAHVFLTHQALSDDEILALVTGSTTGGPLAPFLVGHGDYDAQDPLFLYYPLQGATDLTTFHGDLPLAGADVTTAGGLSVANAPTPWQVDVAAIQLRQEERQ